ncbi:MAG: DUF1844 domain-containing protein [Verrucomicrobiia bacterium]
MAEVQKSSTASSKMQSRFIEFVLMHAQNILFLLGRIPTPDGGQPQVNLELARIFIDQLEMIQSKTQGNLTPQESEVLQNALANVRLAFVETAKGSPAPSQPSPPPSSSVSETKIASSESSKKDDEDGDEENKKRFTKKYG